MTKMELQNEKETQTKNSAAGENSENGSEEITSELNAPNWSVVSFETHVARNLTYAEAAEKLKQFAAEKVSGLCIITDEAAERIKNQNLDAAKSAQN